MNAPPPGVQTAPRGDEPRSPQTKRKPPPVSACGLPRPRPLANPHAPAGHLPPTAPTPPNPHAREGRSRASPPPNAIRPGQQTHPRTLSSPARALPPQGTSPRIAAPTPHRPIAILSPASPPPRKSRSPIERIFAAAAWGWPVGTPWGLHPQSKQLVQVVVVGSLGGSARCRDSRKNTPGRHHPSGEEVREAGAPRMGDTLQRRAPHRKHPVRRAGEGPYAWGA